MAEQAPPGILQSLQHHLPSAKLGLLIRHAERPPITHWDDAFKLLLTEEGKAQARQLGQIVASYGPIHLFHSPVERCEQTAQALAEGVREHGGQVEHIESVFALGGPYIRDLKKTLEFAKNLGHAFVRTWFRGNLPQDCLMSRTETAQALWQTFVEKTTLVSEGTAVLVSHDWNILALREEYLHIQHENVGWPMFLDGLLASPHDQGWLLRYREHHQILPKLG